MSCPVCGYDAGPVLADWCSGAGGAGYGYQLAGFHTVGYDVTPQPRYPGCFVQADVTTGAVPVDGFDAYHGSPPCTDHRPSRQRDVGTGWILGRVRERFEASGAPWVIENVPGAPIRPDYRLCGCMYGLTEGPWMLRRERWFETSWRGFTLRQPCVHDRPAAIVLRHGARFQMPRPRRRGSTQGFLPQRIGRAVMGIDWMTQRELGDAVPPAYTADIGADLMALVRAAA
jgi:hypothetical protein